MAIREIEKTPRQTARASSASAFSAFVWDPPVIRPKQTAHHRLTTSHPPDRAPHSPATPSRVDGSFTAVGRRSRNPGCRSLVCPLSRSPLPPLPPPPPPPSNCRTSPPPPPPPRTRRPELRALPRRLLARAHQTTGRRRLPSRLICRRRRRAPARRSRGPHRRRGLPPEPLASCDPAAATPLARGCAPVAAASRWSRSPRVSPPPPLRSRAAALPSPPPPAGAARLVRARRRPSASRALVAAASRWSRPASCLAGLLRAAPNLRPRLPLPPPPPPHTPTLLHGAPFFSARAAFRSVRPRRLAPSPICSTRPRWVQIRLPRHHP
ncbi:formin-like protein 5 [Oryza glaberrima]|uniref:formin-like protein 5 n=1 Tax=Oryza glaberrima TaxID=4538 RepID=UPI00224C5FF5|nr:formin-like protein 5 [Oryza glaberrima]